MSASWFWAIAFFVLLMALLDTYYLMPEYVVKRTHLPEDDFSLRKYWSDTERWPFHIISCYLRFLVGWFCILAADQIGFGASTVGTIAASAVIYYTLLIPYLAIMSFFIESRDGIPPGYRLFQFFITRSGRKHVDRSHEPSVDFDAYAFDADVRKPRSDKYQAHMEAEELEAATKRAREEARRLAAESERYAAEEARRTEAAEQAARAAEELHRQKARRRAWFRRKSDR